MRYNFFAGVILCASFAAFAQERPPGGGLGSGNMIFMMVIMFAIIYFLMIRPEQKKQKNRQKMISEMKKGDKVVTIGGVFGTVGNVKDNSVMVKIAENTIVEVRKGAVSEVVNKQEKSDQKDGKK
ncbi:MAG: preprotein translocase subunit YajC [Chitinivibrionales bacterium]|nr:preprotein translocase subunit YajC [Chitinivibrionales bacterium]